MILAEQRCLVTGCSSGIGRAMVHELARRGAAVIATARSLDSIASLEQDKVETLRLDVTDAMSVDAAVAGAGRVDILINNAGFGLEGAIEEVSDSELRLQFETNFFGPWRLCRSLLGGMRKRRHGVIVNISSAGGRAPFPGLGAYRSSKWALEAMSWTLHYEVAHFGIRVLIIEPGLVDSDFSTRSLKLADKATAQSPYAAMRSSAARAYPKMSPRAADPALVARAIASELERDRGVLRLRVGSDADRIVNAAATDLQYERFVVEELGFDWHPRKILADPEATGETTK
jgi:NAD(P)-dependent dehydrogenase (short-subunit alcohol dehydrogenase family)